jgi:acyl dehydratase
MESGTTMNVKKVLSHTYPTYEVKLTNNEVILYALGIGFS